MPKKIEGYREQGSVYEPRKPKEVSKDITISTPAQPSSMREFSSSVEQHINDISAGRSGVPDNYKKKVK